MEDYKKKYKDALERARIWKEKSGMPIDKQGILDNIFPELKVSEDEQSKKWILEYLHDGLRKSDEQFKDHFRTAIAWLEKQGEKGINGNDREIPFSEQKPVDKVEPKFKVGDWIVSDKNNVVRIKSIDSNYYVLENTMRFTIDYVDKCWHLWTIQDAKDGDVLASSLSIFIFKRIYMAGKPEVYCAVMDGSFIRCPEGCWTNEQYYPATREQRDILFQKMKENGYEWDDEKKELKKIEINPDDLIEESCQQQADDLIDIVTEKSTWSEEDEYLLKWSLYNLQEIQHRFGPDFGFVGKCIDWLESIKQRLS